MRIKGYLEQLKEQLDEAYYYAKSDYNSAQEFFDKNPSTSNAETKAKAFDIFQKVLKSRDTIKSVYNKYYNNGL